MRKRYVVTLLAGALLMALYGRLSIAAAAASFDQKDKEEFAARRARLFEKIGDGVAVILADEAHVHAVRFHQSPDFYYLTGIEEPGAVLVLVGAKRQTFVFARRRSPSQVKVEGPGLLELSAPREVYGLTQALPIENLISVLSSVTREARRLYVQLTPPDSLQMARTEIEAAEASLLNHPLYQHRPVRKLAVNRLRELYPQLTVENISPLLDGLRWVKTPYEIERLRRSGQIGAEGIKESMRGTRPGMFEYEVQAAAQFVHTKLGARDAFILIVASGPNTVTWHYQDNSRQMQAGDLVLMDTGANYAYYSSDLTRTWPVSGSFTPEQEKMYRCILDARNAIIAAMKPGATIKQLQDVAEEVYRRHGYHQEFLKLGRYIGHYVGLSVHDVNPPGGPQPLQAGVVFNVEPILEMPERKIHLRLEDTILITPTGAENLTAGAPVEVSEIYALIREKGINSQESRGK
jgi:Xaa-Pro aminopeptidase